MMPKSQTQLNTLVSQQYFSQFIAIEHYKNYLAFKDFQKYVDTYHNHAYTCNVVLGKEYAFNFARSVNSFLLLDKKRNVFKLKSTRIKLLYHLIFSTNTLWNFDLAKQKEEYAGGAGVQKGQSNSTTTFLLINLNPTRAP